MYQVELIIPYQAPPNREQITKTVTKVVVASGTMSFVPSKGLIIYDGRFVVNDVIWQGGNNLQVSIKLVDMAMIPLVELENDIYKLLSEIRFTIIEGMNSP